MAGSVCGVRVSEVSRQAGRGSIQGEWREGRQRPERGESQGKERYRKGVEG